ncbi:chordin-like protein 1 [Amphiura filiformis]|uniref:chordin-like protein 1 n=1 Tax=Amphiura filiformis TaxID=82378 RepID=UPI003B225130
MEMVVSSSMDDILGLSGKRLQIDVCDFGESRYSVGETWHPHLRPHGTNYCIKCTCYSYGQVRCSNTECPALTCANPRHVPGKCCPQCEKANQNRPSTPSPTYQRCQYQEKYYSHGELFTTEDIFLARRRDQCVQCSCSEGNVYCALKTCLPTHCSNPVVLPDSCCPVCTPQDTDIHLDDLDANLNDVEADLHQIIRPGPADLPGTGLIPGDGGISDGTASVLTQLGFGSDRNDRDQGLSEVCESNGDLYYEGQTWHPTLFPFGTMKCILCTCKRGNADCGRVECPLESSLPCDNPIQIHGQCCKTCPETIRLTVHDGIGQSSVLYTDSTQDIPSPHLSLCLRKSEDILFYQYKVTSEAAATRREGSSFEYAIEDLKTEEIELHVWTVSQDTGAIEDFQIGTISQESFNRLQEHDRYGKYYLVGASTSHRLRKLKRKERKIQETCTRNCLRRISTVTKPLKVRTIVQSADCSSSSIHTAKQKGKRSSRSG